MGFLLLSWFYTFYLNDTLSSRDAIFIFFQNTIKIVSCTSMPLCFLHYPILPNPMLQVEALCVLMSEGEAVLTDTDNKVLTAVCKSGAKGGLTNEEVSQTMESCPFYSTPPHFTFAPP